MQGAEGQREPRHEVEANQGDAVILPCYPASEDGDEVAYVEWFLKPPERRRVDVAQLAPGLGPAYLDSPLKGRVSFTEASLSDSSIIIADVKMSDECEYICSYLNLPSGLFVRIVTSLVVLAKPINTASPVTVAAGAAPVVVARCNSTNGKPAAQISWATGVDGNATVTETPGTGSTRTVTSELWLVPTAADNGRDVRCVVSHRAQEKPETIDMWLSIEYPPQVTIAVYDDEWYVGGGNARLVCQADGNPPPSAVTWTVPSDLMPGTVRVKENILTVPKVDRRMNATFVCEASNRLGVGRQRVTPVIRDKPLPHQAPVTGGIVGGIFGIVLLLLAVGAVLWVLWSRQINASTQTDCLGETWSSFDL
ncbi:nectin-2-like isoform X2 [Scleropages formosus]|uniref:nectin-2-like isoform X2 n=1 Tax=Scleropages formosus TaxID=113540 RepID=UPI0010FA6B46|nr:nectin-2-like isoform X2 [Scleropages formosus]